MGNSGVNDSYAELSRGYASMRAADPTVAAAIHAYIEPGWSVANIGAGTGSYEPREALAIEPSIAMLQLRRGSSRRAVQGLAEALPLRTKSVDCALAIMTFQHWDDLSQGVAELKRCSRFAVVLFGYFVGE